MEREHPPFSSFSSFGLLPKELRLAIWEIAACEPQIIPVYNPSRRCFIPALLHTCQESQHVVLGWRYQPRIIVQQAQTQMEAASIRHLYNVRLPEVIEFLQSSPSPSLLKPVFDFSFGIVDNFLQRGNWWQANQCTVWATLIYRKIHQPDEELRLWNLLFAFSLQERYCDKIIYCAKAISITHKLMHGTSCHIEEATELWKFVLEFCRRERYWRGVAYCTSKIEEPLYYTSCE